MQAGTASGEVRHCVLPRQQSEEAVPESELHVPGVRVSTQERQETRREDMDRLRAGGQRSGKEADEANDPPGETPKTTLRKTERPCQALKQPHGGLHE